MPPTRADEGPFHPDGIPGEFFYFLACGAGNRCDSLTPFWGELAFRILSDSLNPFPVRMPESPAYTILIF